MHISYTFAHAIIFFFAVKFVLYLAETMRSEATHAHLILSLIPSFCPSLIPRPSFCRGGGKGLVHTVCTCIKISSKIFCKFDTPRGLVYGRCET